VASLLIALISFLIASTSTPDFSAFSTHLSQKQLPAANSVSGDNSGDTQSGTIIGSYTLILTTSSSTSRIPLLCVSMSLVLPKKYSRTSSLEGHIQCLLLLPSISTTAISG